MHLIPKRLLELGCQMPSTTHTCPTLSQSFSFKIVQLFEYSKIKYINFLVWISILTSSWNIVHNLMLNYCCCRPLFKLCSEITFQRHWRMNIYIGWSFDVQFVGINKIQMYEYSSFIHEKKAFNLWINQQSISHFIFGSSSNLTNDFQSL